MKDTALVLHVGALVSIPMEDGTARNCEVMSMDEQGFVVKFYTPDGVGPFTCSLPHGEFPENAIHRTLYHDESAGPHQSYWKWHQDFTGVEGDYNYIKRQIKKPDDV